MPMPVPLSERSAGVLTGTVQSVQIGCVKPLGAEAVPSGFVKRPVEGDVAVRQRGLAGDEQADLKVHGGRDKAVYSYPGEHYVAWRAELPQHSATLVPGGFGENLTTIGLDERNVCIGDIVRTGSSLLQVTEFRQPCFMLSLRFGDNRLPKAMLKSGRCGWYARVLEEGLVRRGAPVSVEQRPNPTWTISRFLEMFVSRSASIDDLIELAELPGLARHWRQTAQEHLREIIHGYEASGAVEE